MEFYYGITSIILGVLLFFPVRKFMTSISANKFQRKEQRQITEEELAGIRKKMTMWAALIAIFFAFIYNKVIVLRFFGEGGGN
jgi:hypothetical protein